MRKDELIQLVRSGQKGDAEAMSRLMEEIQPSVSYQCRKILGRKEDAEDATQDVLLLVYQKLGQLQEPKAFWGWLNRMTVNHCKNMLMRTHPEMQFWEDEEGNTILDDLEDLDEQAVPDHVIDNQETCRMLSELVDKLPPPQRMCVMMRYYDEIPVKEMAVSLDVPENTVKSRLNYAKKAIKAGVLDYEKQGVKLYGLSPLPFLAYFLRKDAESCRMSQEAIQHIVAQVVASAGGTAEAAGAAAGGTAAGTAAEISGAAAGEGAAAAASAATAGEGAAAAAGAAAAGGGARIAATVAAGKAAGVAAKAISLKAAAIVTAGALLVGGAGGSMLTHNAVSGRAEAEISAATEQIDAEIQAGIEAAKPQTTEDFGALLDEYIARRTAEEDSAWVDCVVEKAETLASNGNYSWAIRLVDNGLNYFPEDERLLGAKERFSAAAPVWLFGMNCYYSNRLFQPTATTITHAGMVYGADQAVLLSDYAGDYIQYSLNGKYSRLTGTVIPHEYFQWVNSETEDFRLVILADGESVLDYRFGRDEVEQGADLDVDINVSGVQVLQIQFYDLNNAGTTLGNGADAKVGLVDFYLYP